MKTIIATILLYAGVLYQSAFIYQEDIADTINKNKISGIGIVGAEESNQPIKAFGKIKEDIELISDISLTGEELRKVLQDLKDKKQDANEWKPRLDGYHIEVRIHDIEDLTLPPTNKDRVDPIKNYYLIFQLQDDEQVIKKNVGKNVTVTGYIGNRQHRQFFLVQNVELLNQKRKSVSDNE